MTTKMIFEKKRSCKPPKGYYFLLIPVVFLILSLLYLVLGKNGNYAFGGLLFGFFHFVGIWLGCMFIVNFLWKRYPWERNALKHLFFEIGLILLYTNLFIGLNLQLIKTFNLNFEIVDLASEIMLTNLITFFITLVHEAAYFYKQWMLHFSESVKYQKDSIEARYNSLKTQVNPHFLFNSLNSLTSLVDDNPKAVDYVQKLSQFMRYVIQSNDVDTISLNSELELVDKYIKLQKYRFYHSLFLEINITEVIEHYIVPVLAVQMLVENAIKHNVISQSKPLIIKIYIEKTYLIVENNYQPKRTVDSIGVGLNNIVERYAYYTTKALKVVKEDQLFRVSLPLIHH